MKTEEQNQTEQEQARGIYRNTSDKKEDGNGDGKAPRADAAPTAGVPNAAPSPEPEKDSKGRPLPPGAKSLEGAPPGPYAYLVQDQNARRTRRLALFIGAGVLCVALLLGIIPRILRNRENARAAVAERQRETTPQVTVTRPKPSGATSALSLPGSIEPLESTTIGARATGYVKRYLADIGDHVRAGQLLAEIETPEVNQQTQQAGAQVAQARSGISEARANVARSEAAVSQQQAELSRLQAALLQARAQRAQALANLAKSKSASEQQKQTVNEVETNRNLARVTNDRYQFLVSQGAVGKQEADEKRAALDAAQARLQAAQATLKTTISDIESFRAALRATDANIQAAQQSIKSGRENVRAAQATVSAGQANVASTRSAEQAAQANLRRAQSLQSFNQVRAPFAGVVTARGIDSGALIGAGASGAASGAGSSSGASGGQSGGGLYTIARLERVRIYLDIPQEFAPTVRAGQIAQVYVQEYPNRTFEGRITRTSEALDPSTRTLRTEVQIDNRDGALLPGMYSNVKMISNRTSPAFTIPASALITGGQGTQVATVDEQNRVHIVPVKVGRDSGRDIEIIGGLDARTLVVTNPTDALKNDMTVKATLQKEQKEQGGGQGGQGGRNGQGQPGQGQGAAGQRQASGGSDAGSSGAPGGGSSVGSGQVTSGGVSQRAGDSSTQSGANAPPANNGQQNPSGQAGGAASNGDISGSGAGSTSSAPSGTGYGRTGSGDPGSSGTSGTAGQSAAGSGAGVSATGRGASGPSGGAGSGVGASGAAGGTSGSSGAGGGGQ